MLHNGEDSLPNRIGLASKWKTWTDRRTDRQLNLLVMTQGKPQGSIPQENSFKMTQVWLQRASFVLQPGSQQPELLESKGATMPPVCSTCVGSFGRSPRILLQSHRRCWRCSTPGGTSPEGAASASWEHGAGKGLGGMGVPGDEGWSRVTGVRAHCHHTSMPLGFSGPGRRTGFALEQVQEARKKR